MRRMAVMMQYYAIQFNLQSMLDLISKMVKYANLNIYHNLS